MITLAKNILVCCLLTWLFTACGTPKHITVSPDFSSQRPRVIAILPIQNKTGRKLTAPNLSLLRTLFDKKDIQDLFREYIAHKVMDRSYQVQEIEITDPLSSKIASREDASATQIAEALGVDAIMVPEIRQWNPDLLEEKHKLLVDLRLRLVSGKTGDTLWQTENPSKIIWVNAPSAGMNFRVHLQKIVDQTFGTLPRGMN